MNEDRIAVFSAWVIAVLTDGEALERAKEEARRQRALTSLRVRWLAEAIEQGELPAADVQRLHNAITCYRYDRQHEQFAEDHRHALNQTQGLHLSADDYDERMARRYGPMCDCQLKSRPFDTEKSATRTRLSTIPATSSRTIVRNRPPVGACS